MNCETCKWFELGEKGRGICRRYPPKALPLTWVERADYDEDVFDVNYSDDASVDNLGAFPVVNIQDWCGEFTPDSRRTFQ